MSSWNGGGRGPLEAEPRGRGPAPERTIPLLERHASLRSDERHARRTPLDGRNRAANGLRSHAEAIRSGSTSTTEELTEPLPRPRETSPGKEVEPCTERARAFIERRRLLVRPAIPPVHRAVACIDPKGPLRRESRTRGCPRSSGAHHSRRSRVASEAPPAQLRAGGASAGAPGKLRSASAFRRDAARRAFARPAGWS
jgi:hypothetical protein